MGSAGNCWNQLLPKPNLVSATCYLETFSPRNLGFYERLGFAAEARFAEPTTGADYVVMVRYPTQTG